MDQQKHEARQPIIGRRDFLVGTAVAGAVVPLGSLAWAASSDTSASQTGSMNTRKLGKLEVSEIGAGAMSISGTYGPAANISDGIRTLRTAHDKGVTFFDTAEVYGPFINEELVGEALAPIRNQVKIATKFGFAIDGTTDRDSRPDRIKRVAEASLKRLRTDRIDLFYQHRVDRNVPIEDVAGAVKDLIQEGKVLHFGLSEPSPRTIRRAHAVQAVTAVQTEYSMIERSPETNGVLVTCEELGIGFVPWGPLGIGYLTGRIDSNTKFDAKTDLRANFDRFSPENMAANMPIVEFLKQFAARKGVMPSAIALAWLRAQKPFIVPIPGTRNIDHLNENLAALQVGLTPADLTEINAVLAGNPVHGGRMSPMFMEAVDVDA
ncbi:aldo/keto reductase [Rhizobium laguerreae]|uniref:aldo/keto reductase n=1 Tax=Rhizobium laguerreae TaxID=1076926 RepID=UPI001C91A0CD|nr:aldo/keto reductase [Rhizobium laguerreae]MBY3259648.1 aldo/keto reductase [Rhizobium laguerreae]MBY3287359.1 aldo/keto reductase [Rhizobium laguerreae]MBY3293982.1 aldo/keto reductase [Rhizobium laguerreae]